MVADETTRLLSRCLSLDLEVNVSDQRIRALAGVRPDSGKSLVFPSRKGSLAAALARLDDLADDWGFDWENDSFTIIDMNARVGGRRALNRGI